MRIFLLVGCLLWTTPVAAEQVAHCTGMQYDSCQRIGNSGVWLTDPNDVTKPKPGYFYQPNGCAALLPGVADLHRVCRDTSVPSDGIPDVIEEMTQAEKDVVDAPILAEQARQAAFTTEVTSNDLCTAELADIAARIQTIHDTRLASIAASTTTFKANVTAISGTTAQQLTALKTQLKDLADRTMTGFTMEYDDLQTLATKLGKCTRARAR